MSNQNAIDAASEQIARIVDTAKAELLTDLYNIKRATTLGAFVEIVSTMDIEGTLKKKLLKATSIYANAHRGVLESTIGFADIDSKLLTGFATLNEQLFDNSIIRTISGHIRTQVVKGVQAGLSVAEIVANVTNASMSNAQMQTLVNTTLNTYSRQVTNQMMEIAPNNTKYVYIGPVDDRTRDECLEYAGSGPITEAEIIGNGWEASLVDGGGFNCRHKWEIASTEGKGFSEQDKVSQQVKDNA